MTGLLGGAPYKSTPVQIGAPPGYLLLRRLGAVVSDLGIYGLRRALLNGRAWPEAGNDRPRKAIALKTASATYRKKHNHPADFMRQNVIGAIRSSIIA